MKITILDGHTENPGDLSWDAIGTFGELTIRDRTSYRESPVIADAIGDAEIVITNKTPISRATLEACPGVRFIAVMATGYDVVDIKAARERGVPVSNVPTYGTMAVAQFSIALLLEICSRVGEHSRAVHEGRWGRSPDWCFWDAPLIELDGKTMGIVGLGRIGRAEARIARALGMEVIACDPHPTDEGREVARYVPFDELCARADVITLHSALTADSAKIIDARSIAMMKDGVIIINNARGGLIDAPALTEALKSGKVGAAGLDVAPTEPISDDDPLLTAPNCIITPHISWAPRECRVRIMEQTARNIDAFLKGSPINVVN